MAISSPGHRPFSRLIYLDPGVLYLFQKAASIITFFDYYRFNSIINLSPNFHRSGVVEK